MLGLVLAMAASAWAVNFIHQKNSKAVTFTTALSTGTSAAYDTTQIIGGNAARFKSIIYSARIGSAYSTLRGLGAKDTVYCKLKTRQADSVYFTIDSQLTTIPAYVTKSIVSNDTLIKSDGLFLMLQMVDSVSDSVLTTKYPVSWDITLKD